MEKDSRISVFQKLASKYAQSDFSEKIKRLGNSDDAEAVASTVEALADRLQQSLANEEKLRSELQQANLATRQFEERRLLFKSVQKHSGTAFSNHLLRDTPTAKVVAGLGLCRVLHNEGPE
jgi:hypothetical protein